MYVTYYINFLQIKDFKYKIEGKVSFRKIEKEKYYLFCLKIYY